MVRRSGAGPFVGPAFGLPLRIAHSQSIAGTRPRSVARGGGAVEELLGSNDAAPDASFPASGNGRSAFAASLRPVSRVRQAWVLDALQGTFDGRPRPPADQDALTGPSDG